jgi:hypothetical protein
MRPVCRSPRTQWLRGGLEEKRLDHVAHSTLDLAERAKRLERNSQLMFTAEDSTHMG